MKIREPTYFELKALLNYIMKVKPEEFDLSILGIDPNDIETVRRFWNEYCDDLRYNECKERVRRLIPFVQEYKYTPEEEKYFIISQARQYFVEKYGTDEVYLLYKQINDEEHEDYPVFYEYVLNKYNCVDVGTEKIMLFPIHITTDIKGFLDSFIIGGFEYATNFKELEDLRTMIAVVSSVREAKLLFCYTKDEKEPQGIPLTSTTERIGVIAWSKKKMAILL